MTAPNGKLITETERLIQAYGDARVQMRLVSSHGTTATVEELSLAGAVLREALEKLLAHIADQHRESCAAALRVFMEESGIEPPPRPVPFHVPGYGPKHWNQLTPTTNPEPPTHHGHIYGELRTSAGYAVCDECGAPENTARAAKECTGKWTK